jgi:hypothetical protein
MRGRIADDPLEVRRQQEVEKQRELDEGFTRRHVANADYEQRYLAVQFDRLLRAGQAIAAKLRGE